MEKIKAKVVPCEVYTRIVGYFRPVQNWNEGKKAEYRDRRMITGWPAGHGAGGS